MSQMQRVSSTSSSSSELRGLGLGVSQPIKSSECMCRHSSITDVVCFGSDDGHSPNLEDALQFPLPPDSTELSYWSPTTAGDSPDLSDVSTPEEDSAFIVHPCLHLMSPKSRTMSEAAALWGLSDALDGALDFGWLMPAVEQGDLLSKPRHVSMQRPAPARFDSFSESPATASSPSSCAPSMQRAFSRMSATSLSTTATSSMGSVMDRKNPLSGTDVRTLRYFGSVPELRRASASVVRRTSESRLPTIISKDGHSHQTPLANALCNASDDDPRAALLRVWLAAEAAGRTQRDRPLPTLPVQTQASPFGKKKRVQAWLGRMKWTQGTSPAHEANDWVKEPCVRRSRSIEQTLSEAVGA